MSYSDILLEHPENDYVNIKNRSRTDKGWTRNYDPIKADPSRLHSYVGADGDLAADWSYLVPVLSDDTIRRQQNSVRPNRVARHTMDSEEDGAYYFENEIIHVVLSKFVGFPAITYSRFSAQNGVVVDCSFQWQGRHVLLGEYKRNLIEAHKWYTSEFDQLPSQNKLTRELRGYATEYECPHIFCWDLDWLILCQFRARKVQELKTCDVDYWVFPRRKMEDTECGYPLRDALYKFLVQGLRRLQCEGLPPPTVDGVTSCERRWFDGVPLWRGADGKKSKEHPNGFERDSDEHGNLLWKRNGQ